MTVRQYERIRSAEHREASVTEPHREREVRHPARIAQAAFAAAGVVVGAGSDVL
jgi:hypothetical protein